MHYSKLASSLPYSSLWQAPDHVRLLFVTLLSICDYEGFVYGSRHGLERTANIHWDQEKDRDPWDALMSPDPDSSDLFRNPENEGRRIEAVDGGFRILNYLYYRSFRSTDDRREQNRRAQKKYRKLHKGITRSALAKNSQSKPNPAVVSDSQRNKPDNPKSAQADADADADADAVFFSSKEKNQKNEQARAIAAPPNNRRELELMGELRAILPKKEMKHLAGLWRKRIRHCSKAVANAIEDFKLRTPDQRREIKNLGAWVTDRYARALTEILK